MNDDEARDAGNRPDDTGDDVGESWLAEQIRLIALEDGFA
jgi:hypothetical protein